MNKNSTLIYIYNNFDDCSMITTSLFDLRSKEFENVYNYLDGINIKAPDFLVDKIISYSK